MAQIVGYGDKHGHQFTLNVEEYSVDNVNNSSTIHFSLYLYNDGYSWYGWGNDIMWYININGTNYSGSIPDYSAGDNLLLAETYQYVGHNSDGSKTIDFSFEVTDNSGQSYTCGHAFASGSMALTKIPRYAEINSVSVRSTTLTSATIQYSVSKSASIYCSVDGGSWGNPRVTNTTSGTFTVTGLSPNARHSFRILARATDSGLDRVSSYFYGTTLDYARVTSASDTEYGNPVNLTFSNLANGTVKLQVKIGDNNICERTNLTSSYSLVFSQTELSNIIRLLKTENTTVTYIAITNNTYQASRNALIILNKNLFRKVDGHWKKCRLFPKDDGTFHKCKLYYKEDSYWRDTV